MTSRDQSALDLVPPSCVPDLPLQKLGQGSFGRVYRFRTKPRPSSRALAVSSGLVAAKAIPRASLLALPARQERLLKEIEILKRLHHRNVVRFIDLEWNPVYVFILMEYCPLGSLQSLLLRRRKLAEIDARLLLRQIVCGMDFIWRNNFIHRDLKPANLLLTRTVPLSENDTPDTLLLAQDDAHGYVILKIADFGIADEITQEAHEFTDRVGSLRYMAPEVLAHETYDQRCDLWSIGAILYEMLAGAAPFSDCQSESGLMQELLRSEPPSLSLPASSAIPSTTQDCRLLVSSLLTRAPSQRISIGELVAHPYIDLDHIPHLGSLALSNRALDNALKLERRWADSKLTLREARSLAREYTEAAAHILSWIEYCNGLCPPASPSEFLSMKPPSSYRHAELHMLRRRAAALISRAEHVRYLEQDMSLRTASPPTWIQECKQAHAQLERSGLLWTPEFHCISLPFPIQSTGFGPTVGATINLANRSLLEGLECEYRYDSIAAIASYTTGLGCLLEALASEQDPGRKLGLKHLCGQWMTYVERLKG
ncbi:kinase-like domain-containing protein [Polychytrium aggregatum]|uniref:kinase-like domain-containing protein n=1 Tax=Polychytrium aggregatum TaxID=110093 RepID=UPI0022FE5E3C|nr:kinase-like domain-containing protein [Polychytrium aggregatum]KAI9193465.1 kinase-like domain-containing protein [Polychytrium aggregatum]